MFDSIIIEGPDVEVSLDYVPAGMPHTNRPGGLLIRGSVETLGTALDHRVRAAQGVEREQDLQRKSSGARARRTELWTPV